MAGDAVPDAPQAGPPGCQGAAGSYSAHCQPGPPEPLPQHCSPAPHSLCTQLELPCPRYGIWDLLLLNFIEEQLLPLCKKKRKAKEGKEVHTHLAKRKDCNCTLKFFLHFSCCKVLNKHCQVSVLSLLYSLSCPIVVLKSLQFWNSWNWIYFFLGFTPLVSKKLFKYGLEEGGIKIQDQSYVFTPQRWQDYGRHMLWTSAFPLKENYSHFTREFI